MDYEAVKIPTKQLKYSVLYLFLGSNLLTKYLYVSSAQDAWFSFLIGILASLPMIGIYLLLVRRYPGFSLVEINDAVFGPYAGKLVSALYIYYFFILAVLNSQDLSGFTESFVLPKAPPAVTLSMFVFLCVWAVRKGANTITSLAFLFTVISFSTILFNTSLLVNKFHFENLLPVLSLPVEKYLVGAHISSSILVGETVVFFMLFPEMREPRKAGRGLLIGILAGALLFLVMVLRDILVLGGMARYLSVPTFSTVRLIDVWHILTRMDILYAVLQIMFLFFRVSIFLYAAVTGICRVFRLRSYAFLTATVGAAVVVAALDIFSSAFEKNNFGETGAAQNFAAFFALVLPAVTLAVSLLKDLAGRMTRRAGKKARKAG